MFSTPKTKFRDRLFESDLELLLKKQGITFDLILQQLRGQRNGRPCWYDIVAANDALAVVIEVATTLTIEEVADLLYRLSRFTEWSGMGRRNTVHGAIAYFHGDPSVTQHAERLGLFLIRGTDSGVNIANEPGFRPRSFA